MSKPRAAISVATSTRAWPFLKSAKALVRAVWLLLPWIAAALIPASSRLFARRLAPCLVRENTNTCCQSFCLMSWIKSADFWLLSTGQTHCFTVVAAALRGVTEISTGSLTRPLASSRISSEKVAENIRFWRCLGKMAKILRISRIKPMSSMRSASSNTKISSWLNFTAFWLYRSINRPGVATNTSTPWRNFAICGLIGTPPNITAERSGKFLP